MYGNILDTERGNALKMRQVSVIVVLLVNFFKYLLSSATFTYKYLIINVLTILQGGCQTPESQRYSVPVITIYLHDIV